MTGPPPVPSFLDDMAHDLHDAAEAALGDRLPDRSLVMHGAVIPADCEMLAVSLLSLGNKPTSAASQPKQVVLRAAWGVVIWRCVTAVVVGSGIPPAATLEAEADGLLVDAWCIDKGLSRAWAEGELFAGCRDVSWGTLLPLGPQGTFAGWQLQITTDL